MKTNILYSAAFTFILSLVLTSCAFLQKEEFAQRKYYNFPRTKHAVEGVQTAEAPAVAPKPVTEKVTAKEETSAPEQTITASVAKKQVLAAEKKAKPFHIANAEIKKRLVEKIETESAKVTIDKPKVMQLARQKATDSRSDSDAMLIVELLLAVVLPPLACILKASGINKWFWITLLLCILSGGLIWGPAYVGGGAFLWVVAAVIALLYVFGVVR